MADDLGSAADAGSIIANANDGDEWAVGDAPNISVEPCDPTPAPAASGDSWGNASGNASPGPGAAAPSFGVSGDGGFGSDSPAFAPPAAAPSWGSGGGPGDGVLSPNINDGDGDANMGDAPAFGGFGGGGDDAGSQQFGDGGSAAFRDDGPDPNRPPPTKPVDQTRPFDPNEHFNEYRRERVHHISAEINVPDRFELFLLGDGEKKISETIDTRTPNSSIFTILKEDHTLCNLLRAHLLKDPAVLFAGYKIPHPLFAKVELRVQTDGSITPKEAVVKCCKQLVADLGQFSREFTKEFELRKMIGAAAPAGGPQA